MKLTVYNTLTKRLEPFQPLVPGKVGMYACGVTVYDQCHIGHGMQAIIYDVIRNYFIHRGFEVTYVRNYTDVDDKIITRAQELGISPLEHSENMIRETEADLELLGVAHADIQPKVSEHIEEIVALIQQLIERGAAYASEGDVYFCVKSFPEYGKLSNRNPDELCSGARIEINPKKKDPLDFALWKAAKEDEVAWPSPWGEGRPGWHIECSAMAAKYLGRHFDIHGGGKDLIFPHHENEIAQSEMACDDGCYANYWIHNGLVTVDGRKMSKSFKNFMSIREAVDHYYPETIRYTILSHHYSSNIDFSEKAFYDAYQRLLYFYNTLQQVREAIARFPDHPETVPPGIEPPPILKRFNAAMDDNFNTTVAIREIGETFKFLNEFLTAKKPKLKQKIHVLKTTLAELEACLDVIRLLREPPEKALAGIQEYLVRAKDIDVAMVEARLRDRNLARADKDWARADAIRDELNELGVTIMDTANGTVWQVQP